MNCLRPVHFTLCTEASSQTIVIYMQVHEESAIFMTLHPPKFWERFGNDSPSILTSTHLKNVFHHINNLHQNIKFTTEEDNYGELAFLDTFLKRNNVKISVVLCGSLHKLINTYTPALTTTEVVRKMLFLPCLIKHISSSTIKMT